MAEVEKIVLDETAIEKFDPTVAELTALVDQTKDLTAVDLKDKEQLELVRTSRITLKKKRVQIEKFGKELRDGANKFAAAVIKKEKELIGIISPEEDRLKAIEAEAEQLAIIEERREKLPARKERLAALEDGVEVSDDDLLAMDSTQFEAYFNARVADKNEKVRQQQEEDQRKKDEEARQANEAKEKELAEREAAAKAKEEANAREEARLQAEKEAREREAAAREEERKEAEKRAQEAAEAAKREAEEAAKKEAEAKAKRERAEKYKAFRASHGWTEETKADFYEKVEGEGADQVVVLFKKLDTFNIGTL